MLMFDRPEKGLNVLLFVIPAQAGIHKFQIVIDSAEKLHYVPRLRGSDTVYDFLRVHHV